MSATVLMHLLRKPTLFFRSQRNMFFLKGLKQENKGQGFCYVQRCILFFTFPILCWCQSAFFLLFLLKQSVKNNNKGGKKVFSGKIQSVRKKHQGSRERERSPTYPKMSWLKKTWSLVYFILDIFRWMWSCSKTVSSWVVSSQMTERSNPKYLLKPSYF